MEKKGESEKNITRKIQRQQQRRRQQQQQKHNFVFFKMTFFTCTQHTHSVCVCTVSFIAVCVCVFEGSIFTIVVSQLYRMFLFAVAGAAAVVVVICWYVSSACFFVPLVFEKKIQLNSSGKEKHNCRHTQRVTQLIKTEDKNNFIYIYTNCIYCTR